MSQYSNLNGVMDTAQAALALTQDPYLGEVTGLVLELRDLSSSGETTSGYSEPGVGLVDVVEPLRFFVESKKNPWLIPTLLGATLGTAFFVGYLIGRN